MLYASINVTLQLLTITTTQQSMPVKDIPGSQIYSKNTQNTNSEDILKAILNNTFENVVLLDKNFKIIFFNEYIRKTLLAIFGKDISIGDDYREYVLSPLKDIFNQSFARVLKGEVIDIELETKLETGSLWVQYKMIPVYDYQGEFLGVSFSALNIDERKQAEIALRKSEEKYHSLFEQANDAIIVTDIQGKLVDINSNGCKLLGASQQDLLGMHVTDFIDPEELINDPLQLSRLIKEKQVIRQRKIRRMNNETVELEVNGKMIEGKRFLLIAKDLSELQELKHQSAIKDSTLNSAFEYSAIGMALVSKEGKFVKVNKELCRIVDYTETELIGLYFSQITYPDDIERDIDFVKDALAGKQSTYRTEKRYIRKNNSIVWVNINISTVTDQNGGLLYFISQIEDITEKRKVTEKLKEREDLLQLFIEHSPAALAMFDKDMKYIHVSKRWINDYNLGDIDIIGKSHYDIFPTIPQHWKDIHQHCLAGHVEKNDEDSFTRENGKLEWLQWEIRPWYTATGEIGGLIMLTEVITGRKESELKFRNLVEKSLTGVYIIQNKKFAYVNPELAEIWGYSVEELNGASYEDIVHPGDLELLQTNVKKRMDGEVNSIRYEGRIIRKDGSQRWIAIFGNTTIYHGTKAIIGTIIDITDSKTNDQERQKIINELLQRNRDLEQFAYIVSHNLRAPVANILGLAQLMKQVEDENNESNQLIDYLSLSANKLDSVIQDLNHILQMKDEIGENKETVKLGDLLEDIKLSISNIITMEGVQFQTDFKEVAEIITLKSYIYSIFYNLITNSIKFRKPDIAPVINIKSSTSGNKVILSFSDNGLGIDLKKKGDQVFGLYKRFHLHVKGKGIGLYMVKTQVETLGGTISISSEPNKGTEFKIEFES